ncbi:barstar family protein [Actinoplanes sp. NPDC049802]|uniref:barstar family protein n=1 Tax=Actinoplanes sp. NPDC049802 TaxID=3154742 RepID=UPI0033D1C246
MSGFPWLLVDQNSDDGELVIAACSDIDGLFVDVPQPPVERYGLLGCEPAGRLRDACDGLGPDWLGNIGLDAIHPPHSKHPAHCWHCAEELLDITVLDARPSPLGRRLLDVTLEGRLRIEELARFARGADRAPEADGYLLVGVTGHGDEDFGSCREVDGVFRSRPAPSPRGATLIGCRPEPPLQRALDALARGGARRRRWIQASIFSVDRDGTAVGMVGATIGAEVAGVRPSRLGDGLLDVTLEPTYGDAIGGPRPTGARAVWHRWRAGRPDVVGEWAEYDADLRHEWAGVALAHHEHGRPDRVAGATYHLAGRHITDVEGFFCAIGEAINGPGGYFGWNLGALHDCAGGGWGAAPGFRLVWHDSEVARAHLVAGYDRRWWTPAVTMDDLLGYLADSNVEVELR